MADFLTNRGAYELGTGGTVWTSATIKYGLLKSTAAPTRAINTLDEITADEISVSGYSRATLGSKTVTESDANNRVEYDAADPTFSALASGQTVGWGFAYRDTGTPSTSPVLGFHDLTDTATNGGDITPQFASAGLFTLNT